MSHVPPHPGAPGVSARAVATNQPAGLFDMYPQPHETVENIPVFISPSAPIHCREIQLMLAGTDNLAGQDPRFEVTSVNL